LSLDLPGLNLTHQKRRKTECTHSSLRGVFMSFVKSGKRATPYQDIFAVMQRSPFFLVLHQELQFFVKQFFAEIRRQLRSVHIAVSGAGT